MRRLVVLPLAALVLFVIAACGPDDPPSGPSTPKPGPSTPGAMSQHRA
ncbi:hypothetical protein [Longispora urticae]